jgi:hypothetical protein
MAIEYDYASLSLSDSSPPVRVGDMVSINARGEAVRSFSLNTASGEDLDALALASFRVTRRYGETDASLRARLMPPSRMGMQCIATPIPEDNPILRELVARCRDGWIPGDVGGAGLAMSITRSTLISFGNDVLFNTRALYLARRNALKQRLRDTQARAIARGGTNPLPLDARPVPLCAERPSCARVCESSDARCLTRVRRRRVKRSDRV